MSIGGDSLTYLLAVGLQPLPTIPEPPFEPGTIPGEGEETPEYGWFVNLVKAALKVLADWLIEAIIRPALENAAWLITWIKEELRYWKYEAMKWLTEVTSTTEGLIVVLALVLAASVTIPQLVGKIAASSVGLAIKKLVGWTKEKLGNVLEAIHFVDLVAVHEALLVLWPEWRDMWSQFSDAVSALAEQLGQGSGYIHAWLSTAHGLSMIGTSLLGLEPEIGELRAVEKSQEFFATIDAKMHQYAHDPGIIITDIIDSIYVPYANEIRDTQTGLIESTKDARDRVLDLDNALRVTDAGLQAIIDNTVPELRERMADNLAGMRDVVHQYQEWVETWLLPPLEAAITSLSLRADYLEQANAVARAKMANPIEIYMATEFLDPQTQADTWDYLSGKIASAREHELDGAVTGAEALSEPIETAIRSMLQYEGREKVIKAPPLSFEPPGPAPAILGESWYQGEY